MGKINVELLRQELALSKSTASWRSIEYYSGWGGFCSRAMLNGSGKDMNELDTMEFAFDDTTLNKISWKK